MSSFHPKTVTVIEKPSKTINYFQSSYTPSIVTPVSSSIFTPVSSADIFVSSSGSENILTVIDKTFAQSPHNHFDTPKTIDSSERPICSECININEEIQRIELEAEVTEPIESSLVNDEPVAQKSDVEFVKNVRSDGNDVPSSRVQDENVWQVEDIKNYNSDQVKSPESRPLESGTPATNLEIDSTSFIVLRDGESEIPNNTKIDETLPNSRDRCADCCFCNPDLHRRDGASSVASCNFCNKRRESSKNREMETKSTNTARAYESLSKSDHTHIRTKSKESDTVSLKCTRTSSRIRRFVADDAMNGNLCDNVDEKSNKNRSSKPDLSKKPPKAPNISPARKANTESPSHKLNARTTSGIRLPSPFVTAISSQSCDSASSQCSSTSCSPGSPKKCPVLPSGRWQNSGGHQKSSNKIRASRYKDFYGDNDKKQVANKNDLNNIQSPNQNTGWSLTLAGTYNEDMAPDVEMRLSFPKKNGKTDSETGLNRKYSNSYKQENTSYQSFQREQSDVSNENYQLNNRAALPTTANGNINPKRTLSKAVIDKNRNLRNYNLPDLSPFNGSVAQQTARKTIKRSEYSVAVASATRTISNYPNGKQQRAMSFQALNANAYRFDNRDRRRDHSVDLGHLSSRRMSIDSQTPSEAMALSILGNAIAPEQKPRVPTMSERDLTRKHNSCFTRNRSFFS